MRILVLFIAVFLHVGCRKELPKTSVDRIPEKDPVQNTGGSGFDFNLPSYYNDTCYFYNCNNSPTDTTIPNGANRYIYGMDSGALVGYKKVNGSYTQIVNESITGLSKVVVTDNNIFALGYSGTVNTLAIYSINGDGTLTVENASATVCSNCSSNTFDVRSDGTLYTFALGSTLYRMTVNNDYSITVETSVTLTGCSNVTEVELTANHVWAYDPTCGKIHHVEDNQTTTTTISVGATVNEMRGHLLNSTNECITITRDVDFYQYCIGLGFNYSNSSPVSSYNSLFAIDEYYYAVDGNTLRTLDTVSSYGNVSVCSNSSIDSYVDDVLVLNCGSNIVLYDASLNEVETVTVSLNTAYIKHF